MSRRFRDAVGFIFELEGLRVTDIPEDHGGRTKSGVTQATYDAYRAEAGLPIQSVALATLAEVRAIFYLDYWVPMQGDVLPDPVALVLFDAAVHSGVRQAIRLLQQVVHVVVDGTFGQRTLQATAGMPVGELVQDYLAARLRFLQHIADAPGQEKFRAGWLHRIHKVYVEASAWGAFASPSDSA